MKLLFVDGTTLIYSSDNYSHLSSLAIELKEKASYLFSVINKFEFSYLASS